MEETQMNLAITTGKKMCSAFIFAVLVCLILEKPAIGSKQEMQRSVSDIRIDYLKLENATVEKALEILRSKDPDRIIFGFEKIFEKEPALAPTVSFEVRDTNIADILNRICQADPRYIYEYVSDTLINVFPVLSKLDKNNILNMYIKDFTAIGKYQPLYVMDHLKYFAPELREFLLKKGQEYAKRTGKGYGVAGSELISDYKPEINIELHNMTIREILNSVAIYNINISKKVNIPPFSWKYEFELDADAPTGLGGYPKWSFF
jgi:hypothetical protein